MLILSHRGYWRGPEERNTPEAFRRSFDLGFGTETDVRDSAGRLVISHDPPRGNEQTLSSFLETPGREGKPIALNIKADGLANLIATAMSGIPKKDWFVFDMSIPEMRAQFLAGNPVFVRMSEVEGEGPWLKNADGVWLDAFEREWFTLDLIRELRRCQKKVCVVSPELHNRDARSVWSLLQPLAGDDGVMLCTDKPEAAREFFRGRK
ncbi:MAG: phosphodiesterase [Elusimicrobia bacterium]|nr:phosphodiesterase [Elusimicrobiota bacterium]